VRKMIKKKNTTWKKYVKLHTEETRCDYTKARNKLRKETRKAIKDYERDIAKQAKSNPKKFFGVMLIAREKVPWVLQISQIHRETYAGRIILRQML